MTNSIIITLIEINFVCSAMSSVMLLAIGMIVGDLTFGNKMRVFLVNGVDGSMIGRGFWAGVLLAWSWNCQYLIYNSSADCAKGWRYNPIPS